MATIQERLARLEAKFDALADSIERNQDEANHVRKNTQMKLEGLDQRINKFEEAFYALVNQAKGARWLAGLILAGTAFFGSIGLKTALDWLFRH